MNAQKQPPQVAYLPSSFRPVETPLMRVGGSFDGGYVVSWEAMQNCSHLLSFGLNTDWNFESEFREYKRQAGIQCGIDAFDPTLTRWLLCKSTFKHCTRRLAGQDVKSIGTIPSYFKLFGDNDVNHHALWVGSSSTNNMVDFNCAIELINNDETIYLKMDIEGSEYEVLDQIQAHANRISGMSIEFHNCESALAKHWDVLDSLRDFFHVAHVHANNYASTSKFGCPQVIEVSYVRKDLVIDEAISSRVLPLKGLDQPNKARKPDYSIRFHEKNRSPIAA